ncbi:MAG: DMT family transporter [Pseudomonadota bacterium]
MNRPGAAEGASSLTVTLALTATAMTAFAANSVLTRLALAPELIAADNFATLRVLSGAAMLWAIIAFQRHQTPPAAQQAAGSRTPRTRADWRTAAGLFVYLAGFSFAYESLDTGTGALILFGTVQVTMLGWGLVKGERLAPLGWLGFAVAIIGLVVLVSPGESAPDLMGALLMLAAGLGWGIYSVLGRGVADPLGATGWNFLLAAPVIVLLDLAAASGDGGIGGASPMGIALALASGAIASGLGYVVWFAALPHLSATRAAAVQLTVPAIAALGGVILLAEPISIRLIAASLATLGGVGIVLLARTRH